MSRLFTYGKIPKFLRQLHDFFVQFAKRLGRVRIGKFWKLRTGAAAKVKYELENSGSSQLSNFKMKIRTQLQLLVIFGKSQLQEMNSQLQLHKLQLLEAQLLQKFDMGARSICTHEDTTGKFWNGNFWEKIWKLEGTGRIGKIWDLDVIRLKKK